MDEMRRLREERDWSQAKLARAAGMDPASLNQIETGKRSPRVETLEKIADALEVEVGDFFPKGVSSLQAEKEMEQRRLRYLDFFSEFVDETAGDIEEWKYRELGKYSDPGELPQQELILFAGGVLRCIETYERLRDMVEGEISETIRSEPESERVQAATKKFERAWRRLSRVTISLATPMLEQKLTELADQDEQAGERRSNIRSIRNIGVA